MITRQGAGKPQRGSASPGDMYIDTAAGEAFVMDGNGDWQSIGMVGMQGPVGSAGIPGVQGNAEMGASEKSWKWERTPPWHWRQLLGQKWRRYKPTSQRVNGIRAYTYETEGQRARNILEETFNGGRIQQAPDWASGNPSVAQSQKPTRLGV